MSSTAWPFFTSMTCESPSQATYRVRPRRKVTTPVVPQRTFCQHNASTRHNVSTAPQLSGYPGAGETPPLGRHLPWGDPSPGDPHQRRT